MTRRLLTVVTTVLLLVAVGTGQASAQVPPTTFGDEPESVVASLTVVESRLTRGQTLVAEGNGWPAATIVQAELCGREARSGSVDCDVATSRSVSTFRDGRLRVELLVTAPPAPCPCVLHVFVPESTLSVKLPVDIAGHPVEPLPAEEEANARRVDVTRISVDSDGPSAWSRGRTVEVTVANPGANVLRDVAIKVRWGREGSADRSVAVPRIEELEPGAEATVEGRFELDGFTFGGFEVTAEPSGIAGDAARTRTTAPIFEIVISVLLLLAATGMFVFRFLRRRRSDDRDGEGTSTSSSDADGDSVEPASDPAPAPFVGAGSGTAQRRRTSALVAAVGGLLLLAGPACTSDDGATAGPEEICAVLEDADVGRSVGGDDLEDLVAAVERIVGIEAPPEGLAAAVGTFRTAWLGNEVAGDLEGLELGDDRHADAYQAAYRLRFSPGLKAAAAVIEGHGVAECGLEHSGLLSLPGSRAADAPPTAVLPDDPLEGVEVDLTAEDFAAYELPTLDIPEVRFDSDLGEFEKVEPRLEAPDLSDRRGSRTGR